MSSATNLIDGVQVSQRILRFQLFAFYFPLLYIDEQVVPIWREILTIN